MQDREPLLHPVAVDDLRPSQMTIGYAEVALKRQAWRGGHDHDAAEYLGEHMIPAVNGPRRRCWIIDNHHLARALHEEGVKMVLVRVFADLSEIPGRQFKTFMDSRNWLHPYDAGGRRCPINSIPNHVSGLYRPSFSLSRRRASQGWRRCKGSDTILRVSLGRFPPAPQLIQAYAGGRPIRTGGSAAGRPPVRGILPAGMGGNV